MFVMIRSCIRYSSPWRHLHSLRSQPKLNSQWMGVRVFNTCNMELRF